MLELLDALNRGYIASVQNSDVRRFDEILAEEFYCSNPDGSLVDRHDFLKQTARPVTITGLEARGTFSFGCSAMSRSSMRAPRTGPLTANPNRAAIPMSGRGAAGPGWRSRRT